jgi:diguanylate cyclase (GGDEF)-like protein
MIQQRARTFTAYGFLLGIAGFAGLGLRIAVRPTPSTNEILEAAALIVMGALSWRVSFSILSRTRFSLDLTYMMTALLCYASPVPVIVGAGTAVLGSVLRHQSEPHGPPSDLTSRLSFMLVNTGTLIAMMLAGEAMVTHLLRPLALLGDSSVRINLHLFIDVASLFFVLTAINLTLMGISVALKGESPLHYLRHHARHVLPLEAYNIPLAVLMVVTRSQAGFKGLLLLAALTLLASMLLKNLNGTKETLHRANEELALRADELAALDSIGREINASLDLNRVFETIHRQIARLLDAPTFSVTLLGKDTGELRHAYLVRGGEMQSGSGFPLGGGPLSWAIKSGRALRVDEGNQTPDAGELDPTARSLLAIPLKRPDNEVMGVLAVASPRPRSYTPRHESMLSSIALHAAIAIENARYYEMATIDQGTGLFVKEYMMQRSEDELSRARRYGRPFSIMMLDLDGFKQINDQYGHPAGDLFLRKVGEAIKISLRSIDIPSRYGGEEFAVLLPETDHAEAIVIAERIRRQVSEIRVKEGGRRFGTTISIGLASYPRGGRRSVDEMIRKADVALYQAKREGKDKVISAA